MLQYITGNSSKFSTAQAHLAAEEIGIVQQDLEIAEIQSDSIEEIALDKAQKAFAKLNSPLFVNDSGWIIPALNGFPGPYMKYMNHWFTSEDFLNLLNDYQDRSVILRQVIVYIDGTDTKIITHDIKGRFLDKPYPGKGRPSDRVISLSVDGMSLVEEEEKKSYQIDAAKVLWQEFASWLKQNSKI
jgi:XTP/dITP diphosphohydrolase